MFLHLDYLACFACGFMINHTYQMAGAGKGWGLDFFCPATKDTLGSQMNTSLWESELHQSCQRSEIPLKLHIVMLHLIFRLGSFPPLLLPHLFFYPTSFAASFLPIPFPTYPNSMMSTIYNLRKIPSSCSTSSLRRVLHVFTTNATTWAVVSATTTTPCKNTWPTSWFSLMVNQFVVIL